MLANLITPVVRCVPRIVRARPRISAAAVTPVVRPVVRAVARRIPQVAMICTVGALPSAAQLLPIPPVPPPVPAAMAAPLTAPAAPLPHGIGAFPLLPPAFFAAGGGGGQPVPGPVTPDPGLPPGPPGGPLPPPDTTTPVPEPASMFGTALLALFATLMLRRPRTRAARLIA